MLRASVDAQAGDGRLTENVLHFARVLRKAGLRIGTDRPLLALEALQVGGVQSRQDVHSILSACLIDRIEHRALFEQAFEAFWRDPTAALDLRTETEPAAANSAHPQAHRPHRMVNRRLAEALWPGRLRTVPEPSGPERTGEVQPSWSDRERLRTLDFDSMTDEEWRAAGQAVAALVPGLERLRSRREIASMRGRRVDHRKLMQAAARRGGDFLVLPRRMRITRIEPVIALVDISGSMSRYSRMFLHFLHALINRPVTHGSRTARLRVAAFVFGTRLTPVTRELAARDPDEALECVARLVPDWSGGTRIGVCLKDFNRAWARRLPLASATVLLVTDGLERADIELLSEEAARLSRSCRRLIWLNPLLRYESFEPEARGVRALLPNADRFLPVHNLESLQRLALILGQSTHSRWESRPWN
jgi:uncharacterized protein with von Willebrand factor type A (vWA) domain